MTRTIGYDHGGLALTGHLHAPDGPARAAILLAPTIAGPNAPMFRRAAMLADLGYLTLVADYYGAPAHGISDFAAFAPLAAALRADVRHYRDRILAALAALRGLPEAAGLPVAAIGFCMGGQAVLELARDGADLACVVSFHGLLDTQAPARAGVVRAPMLACHGHADPLVPPEQVATFQAEMDAAGADWTMQIYAGAKHGFTDPGSDARGLPAIGYHKGADHQSWAAMQAFFDLHLTRTA